MRKKFRLILAIFLLLGTFPLSACTAGGNPVDGTNWELESYLDTNGEMAAKITDTVVTAQFQADKVSGIAGCNNYNSSYQVDGDKLTFGPAASTRKVCAEPAGIMAQEDAYLSALAKVQTYKHRSDKLEMQDAGGETILVFTPAGQ